MRFNTLQINSYVGITEELKKFREINHEKCLLTKCNQIVWFNVFIDCMINSYIWI